MVDELKLYTKSATNSCRCTLKSLKRNRRILWIQKSIQSSAARFHAASHLYLGESLFFHQAAQLVRYDSLDGHCSCFFEEIIFSKKLIETTA